MKVILITGATRGIGLACAKHYLEAGCKVVLNYGGNDSRAEKVEKELETICKDGEFIIYKADVSDYDKVKEMFGVINEKFGLVDALINCASVNKDEYIDDMTYDMWQKVIGVNLTGVFNCSKFYAMQYNGNKGCIINISSGTGVKGRKKGANYCSSKAGVINLTKDFAREYAPNIRVNCIGLGMIYTPEVRERYQLDVKENYQDVVDSIPMGYIGDVKDVVEMCDFLTYKGRYITGQLIFVNGGMDMH